MRNGWTESVLGEFIEVVMGQAPPGGDCNKNGDGIPFVKAGEFTDSFPVIREWTTRPLKFARFGDTLVCVVGATCGKLSKGIDCAIGRSVAALRPKVGLVPGYLWFLMQQYITDLRDGSRGSAQAVITRDNLHSLRVAIPPVREQLRIVDLVASVDAYIAGLEKQVEAVRTARNAVLHQLLTADGKDWTNTTLGECCLVVSSRQSPASLPIQTRYVGLEHVDSKSIRVTRFGEVSEVSSQVTPFAPGDTLFGRLRPYLNKVSKADFHGVCSPEILVLRAKGDCLNDFLYLLASSEFTVSKCVEMSAGTRMPRTSSNDLCSITCLLPPKNEQQRIVEIVSSIDEEVLAGERVLPTAKRLRDGLLSDLLSGEHQIPASYDRFLGAA